MSWVAGGAPPPYAPLTRACALEALLLVALAALAALMRRNGA